MARKNHFAPPGYWLHLIQRGNYRQTVFSTDADRHHFLNLLNTYSAERGVRIAAYALMSNHYHLIAAGDRPDAISLFMMNVNGFYSAYRNATPPGTNLSILSISDELPGTHRRPSQSRPAHFSPSQPPHRWRAGPKIGPRVLVRARRLSRVAQVKGRFRTVHPASSVQDVDRKSSGRRE